MDYKVYKLNLFAYFKDTDFTGRFTYLQFIQYTEAFIIQQGPYCRHAARQRYFRASNDKLEVKLRMKEQKSLVEGKEGQKR